MTLVSASRAASSTGTRGDTHKLTFCAGSDNVIVLLITAEPGFTKTKTSPLSATYPSPEQAVQSPSNTRGPTVDRGVAQSPDRSSKSSVVSTGTKVRAE